ncbi:sigma-54 interaction domain-containing protein [Sulfoacidibacillus thermotolerans]|uniref:sigma-54 interaction domain-containing protein n=1 Tax=Sulfoacidibacillus thermotolerans TaxID=1765684 RepID=UPI001FE5F2C5|nr:sigma 54-interacting transcriptional regulator [Sulfoacidibacillus thermotolerans]
MAEQRSHCDLWLAEILNVVDVGIHAVDIQGVTIYYNQSAAKLDGVNPHEVIGRHVLDVFPSLSEETSSLLRVLRSGEKISHRQQTYTNFRGQEVHTSNTTIPVYSGAKLIGALEVATDMTEVKHLAEKVVNLQAATMPQQKKHPAGGTVDYTLSHLITNSASVKAVIMLAHKVAHTSSPVLVYGETGTEKELLVQGIHSASPRAQQPFIAQNCAALPEPLLEGILFGTVKGSFTGAENRPGLFELAHGGTLFLDELNSMPLDLQAKLLRVLEDHKVRRLGDNKLIPVDVRIMVAMNIDPEEAVQKGILRPDLYYRIRVAALHLPPLRERREDIPLLVNHFVQVFNHRFAKHVREIAPDALNFLLHAEWPGNVRELKHALEAAMIVVEGDRIECDHLPIYLQNGRGKTSDSPSWTVSTLAEANSEEVFMPINLKQKLAEVEREWLHQALQKADGNIALAAEYLGLPRQTLQSKLKKYGV